MKQTIQSRFNMELGEGGFRSLEISGEGEPFSFLWLED